MADTGLAKTRQHGFQVRPGTHQQRDACAGVLGTGRGDELCDAARLGVSAAIRAAIAVAVAFAVIVGAALEQRVNLHAPCAAAPARVAFIDYHEGRGRCVADGAGNGIIGGRHHLGKYAIDPGDDIWP